MTEDKQYQLNELNASDILSHLVTRVVSMEEHIRREKKQSANLEKENAELKKQLEMSNKVYNDNLDYSHHIEEQLTKAIEHLKDVYKIARGDWNDPKWHDQVLRKAEQFLKDDKRK